MKINRVGIIAALALGGLAAFVTFAQAEDTNKPGRPPGGPRGDMKERAAKVAEELGLSEEQKARMGEAMKEQGEKRKALQDDTSLSDTDKKAKGKALREETVARVKAILTAEQFTKWETMQQNRRSGGPGGPGGPGGSQGKGKPPGGKPDKD